MEKYNGWTNYETWLVNLWLTNDEGSDQYMHELAQDCIDYNKSNNNFTREETATLDMAKRIQQYIEEMAKQWMPDQASMFTDFINAGLSSVNWYEIAAHFIEDCEVSA